MSSQFLAEALKSNNNQISEKLAFILDIRQRIIGARITKREMIFDINPGVI